MAVRQKRFGRTGLTIPEITFGGGWVGGLLIRAEEAVREAVLEKAMAAGVDWIDTAASYGQGASERVIGGWLRKRQGPTPPRISTKFGVDVSGTPFKEQMLASVEASLERLGLDKVQLIILHNRVVADGGERPDRRSNTVSELLASGGGADAMDELKARGWCDHIGITALGEPAAVREVVESGRFDVAQVYYNLLNPTAMEPGGAGWNSTDFDGLLHACEAQDMGVMGIRIFAGGHLATSERHGREVAITSNAEAAAEDARVAAALDVIGSDHGVPAQAALRFGLGCPLLSTIVVGLGDPEHFDFALAAVEMGPLPDSVENALGKLRARHPAFRS